MSYKITEEMLTNYALNECAEDEKKMIDLALLEDDQLMNQFNETKILCQLLQIEYQQDTSRTLSENRKMSLNSRMKSDESNYKRKILIWSIPIGVLAAAAAVVLVNFQTVSEVDTSISRELVFELPQEQYDKDTNQSPVAAVQKFESVSTPILEEKQHMVSNNELINMPVPVVGENDGRSRRMMPTNKQGKQKMMDLPASRVGMVFLPEGLKVKSNTEAYDHIDENRFISTAVDARSTFSIDVDTASYSNVRRILNQGSIPSIDSVRAEEFINYFKYDYEEPKEGRPFSVNFEVGPAPWKKDHRIVKVGIKGKSIDWNSRPHSNLVFLLDVSGSMMDEKKLPLLKKSLKLLLENLGENDRVAIVTYAGASGLVLKSTSADSKVAINKALDSLEAGGSTNGGEGIQLAYKVAQQNFIKGGINRIILATDGDFNVGVTSQGELTRLVEEKAKDGVYLSILGFGMGNYKDASLEKISGKGNGNYAYIDNLNEAKKVLVEQAGGTMYTIAKDVKIQVEFNPRTVQAFRLIGYENRKLNHQDFNNDKIDAGEIGAGHRVTALYEIVPVGVDFKMEGVDSLKYQQVISQENSSGDLLTIKLRYKAPDSDKSNLANYEVKDGGQNWDQMSNDFKFASVVSQFAMILKNSEFRGDSSIDSILLEAEKYKDQSQYPYRYEFFELVRKYQTLLKNKQ